MTNSMVEMGKWEALRSGGLKCAAAYQRHRTQDTTSYRDGPFSLGMRVRIAAKATDAPGLPHATSVWIFSSAMPTLSHWNERDERIPPEYTERVHHGLVRSQIERLVALEYVLYEEVSATTTTVFKAFVGLQ